MLISSELKYLKLQILDITLTHTLCTTTIADCYPTLLSFHKHYFRAERKLIYYCESIFQNSPDEVHQQLWRKVDYEKSKQILNLIDGAAIVQSNPHYGFIMESVQAEGLMKKYCNLKTLGDLGQRHYALAFPKGSEWTDKVSKQILRYVESGTIYHLKRKWDLPQNCVQSTANETSSSSLVRSLPYRKICYTSSIF